MIRRPSPEGLTIPDLAARFLVVAAGLSLNDLFTRAFNVGQVASPAMFLATAALLLRVNARSMRLPTILLLGALASYIGLGMVFSIAQGELFVTFKYLYIYAASGVFALGLINYVVTTENDDTVRKFFLFTRNVYTISAALILVSPLLDKILVFSEHFKDGRFRGLFSNPNEASYVGIFAWILCAAFPFKDRRLQILAALAIIGGVVCTLSKSGIVVLVAVMIYQAFDLKRPNRTLALIFAAAFGLVMLQNVRYLVSQIITHYSWALSSSQMIRLVQITSILGGQIDSATSTGRTLLWQLALERFASNFPLGGGLGSFHFLVGGISERGVWQGAHNLFLMILGEAGPVPLLLLLLMGGICVSKALSLPGPVRKFLLLIWFTLTLNALSGHNTLELRHVLVILAIALGLTIRLDAKNLPRRAPRWRGRGPLTQVGLGTPVPSARSSSAESS